MQQQLLASVTQHFGLQVLAQRAPLVTPQALPLDQLQAQLGRGADLVHCSSNEKTRVEVLVAPLLLHLAVTCKLNLYCGSGFNADLAARLSGTVIIFSVEPRLAEGDSSTHYSGHRNQSQAV